MEKEIMECVKKKARELSLTQKQIAKELNVSLPTVKRWWGGKGISIEVLGNICVLLGLTLSDIFLEVENQSNSRFSYTLEQERLLVQNPQALALFDLLISGKSLVQIKRKYNLNESLLNSLLLKLDRVGLIELHAENRIKFPRKGEPQWIVDGPLSQKYRKTMIQSLLGYHEKTETTFLIHDYLPEDVLLIQARIRELERLMEACNLRSAGHLAATSYGTYIAFKKFEWDLRTSLSDV